jgi:TatD DNase family protein
MLIDTHTHLYSSQFDEDRIEEIKDCLDGNVKKLLLPNVDSKSIAGMHQLAKDYPDVCLPMMGVHPCSIQPESWKEELQIAKDHLYNRSYDYIAVGEIGIDLHWDKSTLGIQQEAFAEQIIWAKDLGLPIVIHARESFNEIFEVVDQYNDENLKGIFHCFTGGKTEADKILNYGGFLMGIGGVLTFKNGGVAEVIKDYNLDSFVLETDAPYLAPTPNRGKRNQSSYLPLIAEKMADVFGVSLPDIEKATTANAEKLFNI